MTGSGLTVVTFSPLPVPVTWACIDPPLLAIHIYIYFFRNPHSTDEKSDGQQSTSDSHCAFVSKHSYFLMKVSEQLNAMWV